MINLFAWKTALGYLPVFFAGIITVKYNLSDKINRLSSFARIALICVISMVMVSFISLPRIPFGVLYMNVPTYVWLICIYSFLYGKTFKKTRVFVSLDTHSMGIYIIHHFVIWAILGYIPGAMTFMDEHYLLAPVLLFFLVFLFSWVISIVFNSSHYTSLMFNLNHR